jgi:hypothetical protein
MADTDRLNMDDETFYRVFTPCEEDRRARGWPAGGHRWFKSENVIDLVKLRATRKAKTGE